MLQSGYRMYLYYFQLKPYVPYNVSDIKQSEFTAKDLFLAVYGYELGSKGYDMTHEQLDEYLKEFKENE